MHDGGVALHPHPAAVLGQEAVILGGDLSFHEHCGSRQALFVSGPLGQKAKLAKAKERRGCETPRLGGRRGEASS